MQDTISPDARLALDLALTIRHDGHGGVADDLTAPEGLTAWVRAHADTLPGADGFAPDETVLLAVRELRAAVRALFARAVHPGEPSPADASRLLPVPQALERLNTAAALAPTVPVLHWPEGADPVVRHRTETGGDQLAATLARAAVAFLASPDRQRLRACHAPRCVRYFLKEHPRQEWCKPSCGNRARVARHHERHRKASAR
ncbi:CGNR zinc finger domain-containing protein [Streptomyces sp. NPDC002845]